MPGALTISWWGGAVHGGDFYGVPGSNGTVFPTVVANGPDDTDQGGGA
jgi:hypothetical protein